MPPLPKLSATLTATQLILPEPPTEPTEEEEEGEGGWRRGMEVENRRKIGRKGKEEKWM